MLSIRAKKLLLLMLILRIHLLDRGLQLFMVSRRLRLVALHHILHGLDPLAQTFLQLLTMLILVDGEELRVFEFGLKDVLRLVWLGLGLLLHEGLLLLLLLLLDLWKRPMTPRPVDLTTGRAVKTATASEAISIKS